MDSSLKTVSKLFSEKIYRIPDYQRGYAWRLKEVKDFWSDVMQLEDKRNHYLGVLTLEDAAKSAYSKWEHDTWIIDGKSYEPYYVVDGQQRLTTTMILIQCICEVAEAMKIKQLNFTDISEIRKKFIFETNDQGISRSYLFGYEKDNPSYEFLKIKIYSEPSPAGYSKEETIYTTNLENSKNYLMEELLKLEEDELEVIYTKVTQHLLFNTYAMKDDIDVFVAFESMNNRGLRLSNLELLKNRLIFLTTKLKLEDSDKAELRSTVNNAWKAIYHYLGKNKSNPLRDDEFLLHHTKMFLKLGEYDDPGMARMFDGRFVRTFRGSETSEWLADKLLEDVFSAKRNLATGAVNATYIKTYAENIAKSVEIWFNLQNPWHTNSFNDAEKLWIDKLLRLKTGSPGFKGFYPYLIAFYMNNPTKKQSLELLKLVEKYGFLNMFAFRSFRLRHLDRMSKVLYKSIDDADKFIELLRDEVTEITESIGTDGESDAFRISRRGFYDWPGIKYLLFEYDSHLKSKSKQSTQKIDWMEYLVERGDYVTVEHIFPQKAKATYWKNNFGEFTSRQREKLCDSLGNLLPLSVPKNSSLQNKPFSEKVDNGDGVGFKYGCYAEIEVSGLKDWNPEQILARGVKLLEFVESRWGIKIGDQTSKAKFLNLDFMIEEEV